MEKKKKIILFTGPNCATCLPVKEKLLDWHKSVISDIKVEIADISKIEVAKFASQHLIMSVPTILYLEDEKPIRSLTGPHSFTDLLATLDL